MYPNIIIIINILMRRNIIVSVNVRHIVIIGMVVANRTPFGLTYDVYA